MGHIQISSFDGNRSFEDLSPINIKQDFYPSLDTVTGISRIQVYARKPGIVTTDTDFEGIVLKGIDHNFDWSFFEQYLVDGRALELGGEKKANEVLISRTTANRLGLKVGDKMTIRFLQKPPRARRPEIVGIYNTGLEEYDEVYALYDIRNIRKLNDWEEDEVGGFEVFLDDVRDLDQMSEDVYYRYVPHDLLSRNLKEINPNVFEWLALQDINEWVILVLLTMIAIINMITALLILILDRTNMIGILKALGANNWQVRKIFLYNAAIIIGLGLLLGNALGLGLCWLQQTFEFIRLPEDSYYISVAPIKLNWITIVLLNLATMGVCLLALMIPSILVTRIKPITAIRFR